MDIGCRAFTNNPNCFDHFCASIPSIRHVLYCPSLISLYGPYKAL